MAWPRIFKLFKRRKRSGDQQGGNVDGRPADILTPSHDQKAQSDPWPLSSNSGVSDRFRCVEERNFSRPFYPKESPQLSAFPSSSSASDLPHHSPLPKASRRRRFIASSNTIYLLENQPRVFPGEHLDPTGAQEDRTAPCSASANHLGSNWNEQFTRASKSTYALRIIQCQICTVAKIETSYPQEPPASTCLHSSETCRTCLEKWLESQVDNADSSSRIQCPQCDEVISYQDIKRLALPEAFEK